MQKRTLISIPLLVIAFVAGIFCGRYFFGHIDTLASLRHDTEQIEYEFGDSGGDKNIPRSQIVDALNNYLKIIRLDPKDEDAYLGAADCYMRLGALREANGVRDQAKSHGVKTKNIDDLILAFKTMN